MKKIIGIFCVIAIVASLVSIGYASTDTQIETTTSEAYIPSETSTTTINSLLADNERINTNNKKNGPCNYMTHKKLLHKVFICNCCI